MYCNIELRPKYRPLFQADIRRSLVASVSWHRRIWMHNVNTRVLETRTRWKYIIWVLSTLCYESDEKKGKGAPATILFFGGSLINLAPEPGACSLAKKCELQAQHGGAGTSDGAGIVYIYITYRLLARYLEKGNRGHAMHHFYYPPVPANPGPPGWYPLHKNGFPGRKSSYFCSIL